MKSASFFVKREAPWRRNARIHNYRTATTPSFIVEIIKDKETTDHGISS